MIEIQSQSALKSILYINTIIPRAIGIIAGLAGLTYPLTEGRFNLLVKAIDARRKGKEYSTEDFERLL